MRLKKGYKLQNIQGNYVVVREGVSNDSLNSITLNDTAVFLWNLLRERDVTKTQMLEALINSFDISTVLALGDIDVFVRTMKENDIIEE